MVLANFDDIIWWCKIDLKFLNDKGGHLSIDTKILIKDAYEEGIYNLQRCDINNYQDGLCIV